MEWLGSFSLSHPHLVQLCNYPGLVHEQVLRYLDQDREAFELEEGARGHRNRAPPPSAEDLLGPAHEDLAQSALRVDMSGKLTVLDAMLSSIRATHTGDRVVIVSNWTMTLDVMELLMAARGWKFLGSTS